MSMRSTTVGETACGVDETRGGGLASIRTLMERSGVYGSPNSWAGDMRVGCARP